MISWGWFDIEDDEIFGPQAPFLHSVRSCAESWEWCEPGDTYVLVDDEQPADRLRLVVDVTSLTSGSVSSTLGVFFRGNLIECGELHAQDFSSLLAGSRLKGLKVSGTPEALGRAAAVWLAQTASVIRSR